MTNFPSVGNKDITNKEVLKMFRYVKSLVDSSRYARFDTTDKGECWSLVYKALEAAGASRPCTICGFTASDGALYQWGRLIASFQAKSGDVIQVNGKTRLTTKRKRFHHFKHHSMLIISKEGSMVRGAQQWAGRRPHYTTYDLLSKSGPGQLLYYRPQQP